MRCRVKVLSAGKNAADCEIIDLGIHREFSCEDLSPLSGDFCVLGPQAVTCALAGVDDLVTGLGIVKELIEGGSFTAIVANRVLLGAQAQQTRTVLPKIVLIDEHENNVSKLILDKMKSL